MSRRSTQVAGYSPTSLKGPGRALSFLPGDWRCPPKLSETFRYVLRAMLRTASYVPRQLFSPVTAAWRQQRTSVRRACSSALVESLSQPCPDYGSNSRIGEGGRSGASDLHAWRRPKNRDASRSNHSLPESGITPTWPCSAREGRQAAAPRRSRHRRFSTAVPVSRSARPGGYVANVCSRR